MLVFTLTICVLFSMLAIVPPMGASAVASPAKLVIGFVYFGTDTASSGTHSFVEIYNPNGFAVTLTDTYSLQYKSMDLTKTPEWIKLDLVGVIPAYHSFLVNMGVTGSLPSGQVGRLDLRAKVFDQDFTDAFGKAHNKGVKVVIMANQDTLPSSLANPFTGDGKGQVTGYMDMYGVSGNDASPTTPTQQVDGYETACIAQGAGEAQSKQKGFVRLNKNSGIKYADTDNNLLDFQQVDFRSSDLNNPLLVPRSLADGAYTAGGSGDDNTVVLPAGDQNGTPYTVAGDYDVRVPHVIINQIYGGQKLAASGYGLDDTVPVSHSFCELYNPTDEDIDLTGWTLHYGHNGEYTDNGQQRGDWAKLELEGTIKAHTSFLVRMMPTTASQVYLRLNLYDGAMPGKGGDLPGIGSADQDWNQFVINKGGVFVLVAGDVDLENGVSPFDNTTGLPVVDCYVDMLGVGGNDSYNGDIFAYESNYTGSQSKQKALRRIDFTDTDHNAAEDDVPYGQIADVSIVGYNVVSVSQLEWARPRTQLDGVWATYQGNVNTQGPMPAPDITTKLDVEQPNCLTNIVGSNSGTTRFITWQMPEGTVAGKVKYSLSGDFQDAQIADADVIINADGTVKMVVSLTGLTAGATYYYNVAGDGEIFANSVYSFTTDGGGTFSFIHVSDTQGVDRSQYFDYWSPAVSAITAKYSDVAFLLETGDLIDTKNDVDQWRWFFESAQDVFGNYAFFPVVGNHEQTANYDADLFRQHFTVPNLLVNDAVTPGTVYSFNYGSAHFVVLNSECKTEAGKEAMRQWLENDLKSNTQTWTIAAFHRGPFGMGADKVDTYWMFTDILSDYGADLILHGHDHVYMRCYDESSVGLSGTNLIYTLETGGSGFKQDNTPGSGQYVDLTVVIGNPSYSIITVSEEKISIESVYVDFNTQKDKKVYPITVNGGSVDFEICAVNAPEPETYTITFNTDNGLSDITVTVSDGSKVQKPADPVKDGYTFTGWFNGQVVFDFNTPITSDLTLTAHWTKIPVPITVVSVAPMASVKQLNGNKNDLTIIIIEQLSNGQTNTISKTFSINNNVADTYTVGSYKVYVDTKGNTQIRDCRIV